MSTSAKGHLGQVLMGQPTTIPNVVVDAPNAPNTVLAGEIIPFPTRANPLMFGVSPNNVADDAEVTLSYYQHFLSRKKAGQVWAFMSPLTLKANVSGVKNDYVYELAAPTDDIHAYAMEAAASADTDGWVLGPLAPPFAVMP